MEPDAVRGDRLPRLESERTVLRPLEERDLDALFAIFSDPEVTRYWSEPAWRDPGRAAEYLAEIRAHFAERSLFQWGVARRADDRVVGTATLFQIDPVHRRGEIGFALARSAWGEGLMSATLRALFDFAFGELGLHRLEADVDPRNEPSLRLLERLGFRREGLLRERYHVAGEVQDSVMLGLLAPEWRAAEARRHGSRVDDSA